jgi:hypothetical protein
LLFFIFVIKHEGRIFRSWLTMFMDMRSRKITGWHIDVVPNTLTIMRAFSMSVETCGLFENLLVDNGKDFKSAWFAGNGWKARRTRPEKETLELIEGVLHDCPRAVKTDRTRFPHNHRTVLKRTKNMGRFKHDRPPVGYKTLLGQNQRARQDRSKIHPECVTRRFCEVCRKRFNAKWEHSGQGMGGEAPDCVFARNLESRREMPQEMRKYIFAIRQRRTVQKKGICIDGIDYYSGEMVRLIGEKVEVRRDINDAGKISIFSLPDFVHQFDAENYLLKDRGIPEENIRKLKSAKKKARAHLQDYAKRAAEVRNEKKTPYELYVEQTAETNEDMRLVVNGDPIQTPALSIVKTPKRKIRGIFDVD